MCFLYLWSYLYYTYFCDHAQNGHTNGILSSILVPTGQSYYFTHSHHLHTNKTWSTTQQYTNTPPPGKPPQYSWINKRLNDLEIPPTHLYAWTDSSIVLGWLSNPHSRWKVFVSNHVTQILSILPSSHWRHLPSQKNPADRASRGLLPADLLKCSLWSDGPGWLLLSPPHWPPPITYGQPDQLPEARVHVCPAEGVRHPANPPWLQFSSHSHPLRIISWCWRSSTWRKRRESLLLNLHPRRLTRRLLCFSVTLNGNPFLEFTRLSKVVRLLMSLGFCLCLIHY